MPRISVIVPVYKVEKYIRRCVDSILSQTFSDFELILVDDGSPDNCPCICDEYAAKDNRIHVIHQQNGGLSAARNTGIDWAFANSDSEWLTFIDSDDWVHQRYLEALFKGTEIGNLDVVIGGFERTDGYNPQVEDGDFIVKTLETDSFYKEKVVNATVAWGKLYRKPCFSEIRYPVGKVHEDEFVTYKILFQREFVGFIDAPLYAYFINENGIMHTLKTESLFSGLDAQRERIEFFRRRNKEYLYQWQLREYIRLIAKHISNCTDYNIADSDINQLKGRLKTLLKDKSIRKDYPFIEENYWVYKIVYPKRVLLYDYKKIFMKKLFRFFGRLTRKN